MKILREPRMFVAAGMLGLALIVSGGCGSKPVEKIKGIVTKEDFIPKSFGTSSTYRMEVDSVDEQKRLYTFRGRAGEEMNFLKNVGDEVNLPKSGQVVGEYDVRVKVLD